MRDAGALSHAPGRRASALPVPTLLLLSFLSLGAPFALALAPAAARAATFTGLGFLTDGTGSVAFGLSADGSTVVGSSSTPAGTEAFRWTSGGGMQPLGTLGGAVPFSQAFGVSADGSAIVGESNSIDGREAFVWTAGGGMVGLDDLAGGGFFSQARGISNDGGVVVGVGTSGSGNEAFRWTSGGGLVGLGDLAGGQFASDAYAASGDGSVVVGFGTPGTLPSDASHDAFRWTQTDGPLAISDPLVLAPDNEAYGVSPDGAFVVGRRSDALTDPQAFLWTAALGMSVLGDLPGGAVASAAFDVSADGTRVVGAGDSGGDENAFLWVDGVGLRALRDVIAGDYGLDLTGWELFAATAISDDGNAIAGWGRHDGVNQAFLFVVPEPATAPLLAVALAALAGGRRRRHCAGPRRHRGASRAATALGAAALLALVACGPTDLEHYRGAVHEHSGYSDGVPGSVPADYFAAADAAGLDFLGSGEHSDSEDVPVVFSEDCLAVPDIAGCAIADPDSPINSFRKWEATGEQAAAATTPDFTAFRGFEWTSDRFGHINVYFSRQAVNAKIDGGYATMEAFWAWFTRRPNEGGGGDGLATFNHPDDKKLSDLDPGRNWNDFAYVPAADDRVVGIEVFNGGSRDDYADWYVRALDKGWHVGAVGAEDSHGPTWATPDLAKTVLIARDRSPGALYEAMYARRMYAQLDADVRIDMFAGGQPMGSQLARKVGNNAPILANVAIDGGAGTVTQLDLISNGGVVVASAAGPLLLYDAVVTADERWYFLRVTAPVDGTDQVVAYSSPVWIREAAYPPRGHWVAGDLHVHTTYSHDSYGGPDDDNTGPDEGYTLGHTVDRQFIIGAVRGLDYLAITDHNDVRSQSDPGFATQNLVGLPSYENSLQGHAQMHGATRIYDNGDSSIARVRALADELRADGGVFQVNHPAGESVDFPDDADWKYFRDGYEGDVVPDAVEILNISSLWQPPAPSSNSIDDAIRYWEGFLDRGHRVAATGGSDNHWVSTTAAQGAGQPATWVFVTERSVRGVLEGLRAGHTFISYQPPAHEGPRVFLEADRDRDGVFESKVGNRVPAGARFRVSVEGGSGMLLDLVYDGSRRLGLPMPVAGAPFVYEFDLPAWATWVRAELYTADLDAERTAVCDGLVGDQSTLCRNRLAITGLTSAIYQHP